MTPAYIDKYQVKRVLGSGTIATVYHCHDPELGTDRAVKVLHARDEEDERARRWFLNKARDMFGVNDPHIVRIVTTGALDDGQPYIVMEYADGGSLASRIAGRADAGGQLSLRTALEISLSLAEGLKVAHDRGLVHRNLKPSNVLFHNQAATISRRLKLDVDEQVKIVDFGISRGIEDGAGKRAGSGTPNYVAPEQAWAMPDDSPDPRSDIYAAAAILYELLTGRVPFPRVSFASIASAHRTESPPQIQSMAPEVPDDVAVLVHAGLSNSPEYRVQTAGEWVTLLEDSLERLLDNKVDVDSQPSAADAAATLPAHPAIDEQPTVHVAPVVQESTQDHSAARKERLAPLRNLGGSRLAFGFIGVLIVLIGGTLYAASALGDRGGDSTGYADPTPTAEVNAGPELTAEAVPTAGIGDVDLTPEATVTLPLPTTVPDPDDDLEDSGQGAAGEPAPTPTMADDATMEEIDAILSELPDTASAAVIHPDGRRAEVNADRQVPAASLIKLWIAAAALDEAASGRIDLTDTYVVREEDRASGTGILQQPDFLGSEVTYLELIEMMLLHSDNSAANIVSRRIGGFDRINRYVADHGYQETRMQRMLGALDPSRENYTSARDVALYLERMRDGTLVNQVVSGFIRDLLVFREEFEAPSLNYFGAELPDQTSYGHLSGVLPGFRSDAGFYLSREATGSVIVTIMLDGLGDGAAGERLIAETVRDIRLQLP